MTVLECEPEPPIPIVQKRWSFQSGRSITPGSSILGVPHMAGCTSEDLMAQPGRLFGDPGVVGLGNPSLH